MELSFVTCLEQAHAEHHAIFDAFRHGDAARVAVLSRLHAEATAQRFLAALTERGLVSGLPGRDPRDLGPAAQLDPEVVPAIAAARKRATALTGCGAGAPISRCHRVGVTPALIAGVRVWRAEG